MPPRALTKEQEDFWKAFTAGVDVEQFLSNLSPVQRAQFDESFDISKPEDFEVTPPGWEDIIHLGKAKRDPALEPYFYGLLGRVSVEDLRDPAVDKVIASDVASGKVSRSAGKGVELTYVLSQRDGFAVRQIARRRIERSPTPTLVRRFGEVMQTIDDVQDALVTLLYVARLVGYPIAKRIPGAAGKVVEATALVLFAKDILETLTFMNGFKGNLRQKKRAVAKFVETNPRLRAVKFLKVEKLSKLMPSFSEAIQIAQTTDILFGYGISLGGILGFVEDAISGAVRAVVPGGPDVRWNIIKEGTFDPAINSYVESVELFVGMSPYKPVFARPLTKYDLAAIKTLYRVPYILQFADELPPQVVCQTIAGACLAVDTLESTGVMGGFADVMAIPLGAQFTGLRVASDSGFRVTTHRLEAVLLVPKVEKALKSFFEVVPDDPYRLLAARLVSDYAERLLRLYGGSELELEAVLRPEVAAINELVHYGFTGFLPQDENYLEKLYGLLSSDLILTGKKQHTRDEVLAFIDLAHG